MIKVLLFTDFHAFKPPVAMAAVRSKVVVLLLLSHCLLQHDMV